MQETCAGGLSRVHVSTSGLGEFSCRQLGQCVWRCQFHSPGFVVTMLLSRTHWRAYLCSSRRPWSIVAALAIFGSAGHQCLLIFNKKKSPTSSPTVPDFWEQIGKLEVGCCRRLSTASTSSPMYLIDLILGRLNGNNQFDVGSPKMISAGTEGEGEKERGRGNMLEYS